MPVRKKQPAEPKKKTTTTARSGARKKSVASGKSTAVTATRKPRTTGPRGNGSGPNLVIVESPAKARTINKYLGPNFKVMASVGHVRDLPKKKKRGEEVAGVDIASGWKATYAVIDDRKKKVLEDLEKEAKKAGLIYLATDPDREGEAIAWHLQDELSLGDERTFRITFNEITRQAVQNALQHAGKVDMNRVRAQEARRILDRVVGFPLSGLLNRKVKPRSSAGRVQSVALKLVVDREREIRAFVPQEYWKLTALLAQQGTVPFEAKPFNLVLAKAKKTEQPLEGEPKEENEEQKTNPPGSFLAEMAEWNGRKFEVGNPDASNEESARRIAGLLDAASYRVTKVEQKDRSERAPAPFTTSTLQQQAVLRLRYHASRTMKIAQELYQGVELSGEGAVALITYMRTDSTRVSAEALTAVRSHIQASFGERYVPEKPNFFESGKSAQEAHEAIRPTDLSYTPERVATLGLHGDNLRLYTLIYNRFVASQMAPALFAITNVEVTAACGLADSETGLFKAQGKIMKFDGFRRVLAPASGKQEDAILPAVTEQQELDRLDLTTSQHFTQPPPRYNEASLIKALEKEGIGRPSTYATIMGKITDDERGYIEVKDRRFFATEIGERVTDLLVQYFPNVMNLKFTSHFEEELDDIETGKIKYEEVLDEFWGPFSGQLKTAEKDMRAGEETGENCPKCGKPLLKKYSRKTGQSFIGCTDWKECKYIKPREGEEERPPPVETEHKCPTCGKNMIQITGRAGVFLRCSGYPECQTKMNLDAEGKPVISAQSTEHKCEKCGKPMVIRHGRRGPFLACTGFPKCKNAKDVDAEGNPVVPADTGIRCEKCNSPMIIRSGRFGPFLGCSGYPKCRNIKQMNAELKEQLKDMMPARAPKKAVPQVEIHETCPDCGGPMKLRPGRRGYFLGCAKYPKCKGTREAPPEILEQVQAAAT